MFDRGGGGFVATAELDLGGSGEGGWCRNGERDADVEGEGLELHSWWWMRIGKRSG